MIEQITINKNSYDELYIKALKYDALERNKICVYTNKNFDKHHLQIAGGEYFIIGTTYEEYEKFLKEIEMPFIKKLNEQYYAKYIKIYNFFIRYKEHYEKLPKFLKKWYMPNLDESLKLMQEELRTWE